MTAIFVVFIASVRVPTYLGLVAPAWDKEGIEYVWRVWWRARAEMVDVEQTWLFSALLIGLSVVVVVAASTALWLILVSEDPADDAPEDQSVTSSPS
jgi:hypothetical protein